MKAGQLIKVDETTYVKKIRVDKPFANQQKAISKELKCDYSYVVIDRPDPVKHNGYISLVGGFRVDWNKYNLLIIKI